MLILHRTALLGWLGLLLGSSLAHAQDPTRICVEVLGGGADSADLQRLVMTEIDRHATHKAAEGDCASFLRVELLTVGSGQYLTGRINTQVPHREMVQGGDLARTVERMLRVVLHNDPVRLRGPRRANWFLDNLRNLKRGRMVYGVEAFQHLSLVDGETQSLAGIAINVRREVEAWQLGGRMHYAGRFSPAGDGLTLVGHLAVQLQIMWFSHPRGDTTVYFGGIAGLDHQRYDGPSGIDGGPSSTSASLFAVGGRLGVEMFRATSSRVDLFAQVMAPTGTSTDEADQVIDAWVPSATMGLGIAF